jgi:hypothetical protein
MAQPEYWVGQQTYTSGRQQELDGSTGAHAQAQAHRRENKET